MRPSDPAQRSHIGRHPALPSRAAQAASADFLPRLKVHGREVAVAREVAFLIDGEAYFGALREALRAARRQILVVGWDLHGGLCLPRADDSGADTYPETLAELLHALTTERESLEVALLVWDAPLIYASDRDGELSARFADDHGGRLRLVLDAAHPLGSSQHMKIVVIDDELAFCGGIDLTAGRRDDSRHLSDRPSRVDPDGETYPPFHDVQTLVRGPAAAALGRVARERWRSATGEDLARPPPTTHALPARAAALPAALRMREVDTVIARTLPAYRDRELVREVEQLHIACIAAARERIYLESQYFCSERVVEAIEERLRDSDGPEVVLVTTLENPSWLEASTLDKLREHALARLRRADAHGRFAAFYPCVEDRGIKVHSKVAVIDDRIARVGSANLSQRSMGADAECDVLFLAAPNDAAQHAAVTGLCEHLLCEHAGVTPEELRDSVARQGSLHAALDALGHGRRSLRRLPLPEGPLPPQGELGVVDINRPYCDELADVLGTREHPKRARQPIWWLALWMAAVSAVALLVHALGISVEQLHGLIQRWLPPLAADSALRRVAAALLGFSLAATLGIPVTLLVVLSALVLPPLESIAVSLTGALAAAYAHYRIGGLLGRERLAKHLQARLPAISRGLSKRGAVAVASLRLLPVAPFAVVNATAGALRVGSWRFVVGTALGMLPGVLSLSLFGRQLTLTAADPSAAAIATTLGLAALTLLGVYGLERLVARR